MYSLKSIICSWLALSLVKNSIDAVRLCHEKTIDVTSSGVVDSPHYPNTTNNYKNCNLSMTLPGKSQIAFTAGPVYFVNENKGSGCTTIYNLFLKTLNNRTVPLCDATVGTLLWKTSTGKESTNLKIVYHKQWTQPGDVFQIEYTVVPDNDGTRTRTIPKSPTSLSSAPIRSSTLSNPVTPEFRSHDSSPVTTPKADGLYSSTLPSVITSNNPTPPFTDETESSVHPNITISVPPDTAGMQKNTLNITQKALIGSGVTLLLAIGGIVCVLMWRRNKKLDSNLLSQMKAGLHRTCTVSDAPGSGSEKRLSVGNPIYQLPMPNAADKNNRTLKVPKTESARSQPTEMISQESASRQPTDEIALEPDGIQLTQVIVSESIIGQPTEVVEQESVGSKPTTPKVSYVNSTAIVRAVKEKSLSVSYAAVKPRENGTTGVLMVDNDLYGRH